MTSEQGSLRSGFPAPNGCRWCGIDERVHARQWVEEVGWHAWASPTVEQRKARMKARRAARLQQDALSGNDQPALARNATNTALNCDGTSKAESRDVANS
ncbi:hypothetical protein GCM10010195_71220 [Kitasatospora griseola]|nr:hypothetical protein GCM10010195_71220 [Kitasatospora griseola]